MVEPLHRGFVFSSPVLLFTVEDGSVRRVAYDRSRFEFGRLNVPANVGDIGFSGFRLFTTALTGPGGQPVEFAIVQGATFFRALARGQSFGVVARALTLRPAETRGEEFPFFRAFWIERPSPGTNALVVHALIDSESVERRRAHDLPPRRHDDRRRRDHAVPARRSRACRPRRHGLELSLRSERPPRRRRRPPGRAQVERPADAQRLRRMALAAAPATRETLQISAFVDSNPQGFGLIQRERDYAAFQDDEQRCERRPSLWIEPIGEWGQGAVQLIEIPSESEVNDNILAYWRPQGADGGRLPRSPSAIASSGAGSRPSGRTLATVAATRVGRGSSGRRRRFLVDFTGDMLGGAAGRRAERGGRDAARERFRVCALGPIRSARRCGSPSSLTRATKTPVRCGSCSRRRGNPISETWLYRWTP